MNVFISYSTPDLSMVHELANRIKPFAEVFYWAQNNLPGQESWPSIFSWIDKSDLVIAFVTDNTVRRAMAVGQELGRAKTQSKTIVPIVSKQVQSCELGFLAGVAYQPIDIGNPQPAIDQVSQIVHSYKIDEEEQQKQLLTFIVLAAALILLLRK
jgi:hypothetical protein